MSHRVWWVASILLCWGCEGGGGGGSSSGGATSASATGSGGAAPSGSVTVGVGGSGGGGGGGNGGGNGGGSGGAGGSGGGGASGSGGAGGGGSGGAGGGGSVPGCAQPSGGPFTVLWRDPVGGLNFQDIDVDSNGNTYVTGTEGFFDKIGGFVRKYDPSGALLWHFQPTYPNYISNWVSVTVGLQGKFIVTGQNYAGGAASSVRRFFRETGDPANPVEELWSDDVLLFQGDMDIRPNGDIVAIDNGVLSAMTDTPMPLWSTSTLPISGSAQDLVRGDSQNRVAIASYCMLSPCLLQLDPDGNHLWTLNLPASSDLSRFELGPDDSFHAGGSVWDGNFFVNKASANGALLWNTSFSYPLGDNVENHLMGIAVSPTGDVWLAGMLSGYGSFLRGYSATGAFLKETLTGLCGEPKIRIYAIRSDPTGGLRLLGPDGLTAIKP